MGCGCGKKGLPRARTASSLPMVEAKPYRNATGGRLIARNPRVSLNPGATIDIVPGSVSYTVRNWIRTGALVEA